MVSSIVSGYDWEINTWLNFSAYIQKRGLWLKINYLFLTKVDSKWSLKHKGKGNEVWCNGAYVNRKFIIASKYCIEKIPESDLSVCNHYECNHKNDGKSVLKIHKSDDWALLEMPKAPFISYGGSTGTFYNFLLQVTTFKKIPHFKMEIVLLGTPLSKWELQFWTFS